MKRIALIIMIILPNLIFSQIPFYYKLKNVSGKLLQTDSTYFSVRFIDRRHLEITGCKNPNVDTLLRTLTFTRTSRKYLEHLLKTSSQVLLDVSDKVGITYDKGKYYLMSGLTGPDKEKSDDLIEETSSNLKPSNKRKHPYHVFKQNTIRIFRGTILYYYDSTFRINKDNVFLFNLKKDKQIIDFTMDTIIIEPIMYPEIMYKNIQELYYFAGTHEIYHITPENIDLWLHRKNTETDAFILERKMFKKRKKINNMKVK